MYIYRLDKEAIKYKESINRIRDFVLQDDKFMRFVTNPSNLAYYMLDNEKVVAFAWGYVLERPDDQAMLYIHSVDVLEGYKQKGYGTKLIKMFLDYAKKHEMRNTFLITDKENKAANKLYQKLAQEKEEDKVLYIFKEKKVNS